MKLKKLGLFRKTPNRFFVRKSKESEEGGSSLKLGELTFTQEELYNLLSEQPLVLLKTDERNAIIRENDIIKITNFDISAFKYDMKKVQSLEKETYLCNYLSGNEEIGLLIIPYEGDSDEYDLVINLFTDTLATEVWVTNQIPVIETKYLHNVSIHNAGDNYWNGSLIINLINNDPTPINTLEKVKSALGNDTMIFCSGSFKKFDATEPNAVYDYYVYGIKYWSSYNSLQLEYCSSKISYSIDNNSVVLTQLVATGASNPVSIFDNAQYDDSVQEF